MLRISRDRVENGRREQQEHQHVGQHQRGIANENIEGSEEQAEPRYEYDSQHYYTWYNDKAKLASVPRAPATRLDAERNEQRDQPKRAPTIGSSSDLKAMFLTIPAAPTTEPVPAVQPLA